MSHIQLLTLSTPAGELSLRPEQGEHADFLYTLFAANAAAELAPLGLPPTLLTSLVTMQHRAQSQSYRNRFPHARFLVAALDGAPVGRLVEDDEPGWVHIVDIAVAPPWQNQGLGSALLRARMVDWRAAGLGARCEVLATNSRSLAMHRKLGFTIAAAPAGAHLSLTWTPGSPRPEAE